MKSFLKPLGQVLRRLSRAPLFTGIALVMLALGIGANTAIFSVIEGVLLKPLPYPHSNELVGVWLTTPVFNMKEVPISPSMYFILREQGRSFQDIGLYNRDSVTVTGLAEPEQARAVNVTDGTLPIFGIPPMLGRWFNQADVKPGSADTVMLTYGYWQEHFAGDTSIVGRPIKIDGKLHEVIGVMPQQFQFLDGYDPSLILPFKFDRPKTYLGDFSYPAVARVKPGVTLAAANAALARLFPIVNRSFPAPPGFSVKLFEEIPIGPNIRSLKQVVVGDVGNLLWVLMGGIGMVLLIACANVANLVLVRVEGRQHELAVRAALGASRGRLAGELLFESLVLGLLGSVLGLGLAYAALRVLIRMAPAGLPRLNDIGIDLPVLLFTLGIALVASLLFGAMPILKYSGAKLGTGLREAGRALSDSRERHRARNVLVVVQVALAMVLLISSGLMIRTFRALTHVDPGFTAANQVQTMSLSIPEAEVTEPGRVLHMEQAIADKIAAIPGVTSVGLGNNVPMDGNTSRNPIYAQDRTYAEGQLPALRHFQFVAPGYFRTLGTPLLAGRDFTWTDIFEMRPVVMVSENLARELWTDPAAALGKRIRMGSKDDWCEIVGVVGNVHEDGVNEEAPPTVSWPIAMRHFWDESPMVRRSLVYSIRSPRAGSESLMKEVRQAVWSVDPNLPLASVHSLDYYYSRSLARTSFTLVMLAVAGGMALLLGVVGLYGVIAYSVSQRTREIGIRMALGAQRQELTGMFVRHGLVLSLIGVTCGLATGFAATRLMSSLLFHVSPADPLTYGGVALGLLLTAVLASYLPSRRVASVNPVEALRAE